MLIISTAQTRTQESIFQFVSLIVITGSNSFIMILNRRLGGGDQRETGAALLAFLLTSGACPLTGLDRLSRDARNPPESEQNC